jgi:ABC-type phosphate transport system auxiliary subunit
MKYLALAALSITVLSAVAVPSTFALNESVEKGVTGISQNSNTVRDGRVQEGTTVQNSPNQANLIQEEDITALNDRFERARRDNLDLALNDRFDRARRDNLDLALNDRFDRARRDNLDLALNDRFDRARRDNLDLALNDRFDEARRRNLES